MKKLALKEIKKVLGLASGPDDEVIIEHVTNDITKMNNATVVFHLNKAEEMKVKNFERLNSCYVVTDQPLLKGTSGAERVFYVGNVKAAYDKFTSYYRSLFKIPVIAVTGTCGKTTTKEMIAQILRNNYQVVATESSKNSLRFMNDYLMKIDDNTDYAVFETAITHPGNLIYECEFFKPTIGIITTIGIDHLNWCKTLDNYIRTKGELLTGLGKNGILIINRDNKHIRKLDFSNFTGKIITFGIKKKADFQAQDLVYAEKGMKFTLLYNQRKYSAYVPGFGEHNVYNALAALAAIVALKHDLNDAINLLGKYRPLRSHTEIKKGIKGSIIIDDTWSSNPTSAEAALKVLREIGRGKKKVAAFGQISYLGKHAEKYYEKIAKMLLQHQVDILITKDHASASIGSYAVKHGMNQNNVHKAKSDSDFNKKLISLLDQNTVCLIKCSMLDKSSQQILENILEKKSTPFSE
ncbi:MAG TPA: UDP-N-acetylmuramoyl-tripeptide--D-alanyl-D-alanine ligase [Acholeplasmataceae bacterium]|nr:UDP-N-acetylmuramoyl-tripeptide--D-alanyl-D-alanine ligase [Acholeplasmataceae bacterium]